MSAKEANLLAPKRAPLDWKNPEFYDETSFHAEMERVFDVCHGCRRCVSLCDSFPTLFDLIDELGFEGWVGCEYRPQGETSAGLGWAAGYLS